MGLAAAACREGETGPVSTEGVTHEEAREYLLEHPELVLDDPEIANSIERARSKRAQERAASHRESILEERSDLLNSPLTPSSGEPGAAVTIVEFYDYRCSPCIASHPELEQVRASEKDVRIVYGQLPIFGSHSVMAARAAIAAQLQGRFNAFHSALMTASASPGMDSIYATAAAVGLDVEKLRADMRDPEVLRYLEEMRLLAEALDVTGTPAFIVGGAILRGGTTADELGAEIGRQRAQSRGEARSRVSRVDRRRGPEEAPLPDPIHRIRLSSL